MNGSSRAPVLIASLALCAVTAVLTERIASLQHRMTKLEHACGPVDTGGGVVQCAQPNLYQVKPR